MPNGAPIGTDHRHERHLMRDRHRAILVVALLLLSLACSESTGPSAPSITPRELQVIAGDNQTALRGDDLRDPLRVRVLGSDGQPLPGATVQWALTQGQATLSHTESITSSTGHAETRVTNIATVGAVVVRARVQAVVADTASITGEFSITALDPCLISSMPPYELGNPVAGVLRPFDCKLDGESLWDFYVFRLATQQAVTMRLWSDSFVPEVGLWTLDDALGRGAVFNPEGPEAPMKAILAPGAYLVAATSFDVGGTGPYELSISAASGDAGCDLVFVVRGITTTEELASTDCRREGPEPSASFYEDSFWLVLYDDERVTVSQSSTHFGPRLRLQRRSGAVIAEVDGSATGTATMSFTADAPDLYRIIASSAIVQKLGAYTLSVSLPSGTAVSAALPTGTRTLGPPSEKLRFPSRGVVRRR
jgi:hypothetical protein